MQLISDVMPLVNEMSSGLPHDDWMIDLFVDELIWRSGDEDGISAYLDQSYCHLTIHAYLLLQDVENERNREKETGRLAKR